MDEIFAENRIRRIPDWRWPDTSLPGSSSARRGEFGSMQILKGQAASAQKWGGFNPGPQMLFDKH